MAKATPLTFANAQRCKSLRQRVPAVAEINPNVAAQLWEATLANHQAWPKEKIFMAALGIALQLSRSPQPTETTA